MGTIGVLNSTSKTGLSFRSRIALAGRYVRAPGGGCLRATNLSTLFDMLRKQYGHINFGLEGFYGN